MKSSKWEERIVEAVGRAGEGQVERAVEVGGISVDRNCGVVGERRGGGEYGGRSGDEDWKWIGGG